MAIEQEYPLDYRLNEHIVQIPSGPKHLSMLETTVFKPNGPGPFPLLIINHGKELGRPSDQPRDRFIHMATAFVKRGYAVMVPMREGFAASTGRYRDHGCDMTRNGYTQAENVRDAVAYARAQSWVDADRIVVAGQSYGGLATIALGAEALPGVRGLLNFAGGLADTDGRCNWREQLVGAFGEYGSKNKLPTLWMYGVNDSLFDPELVTRMYDAFVGAGGRARLVQFGEFKRDAHGMLASRDGEKVWLPETERFLKQIGMPTEEIITVTPRPALPATNYASVQDVTAVPYLSAGGRAAYEAYLSKHQPRAFAISPSGAWSWAEEGEDPESRALATCRQTSNSPCRLYSVDDNVVWEEDTMATAKNSGAADGATARL
ncbi:MAG TPA: CocE/NonD family hydrolase [Telluria sp.]|nr:CocE/NonD family hydrolase [Telluria sp.]